MFERFLSTIEYNDNLKLYLIVICVIYLLCFSNLLPKKFSSLLNKAIIKCCVIGYILFISKDNLGGALLLTTIYLIVSKCIKSKEIKEGMKDEPLFINDLNIAIEDAYKKNPDVNIDPTVMDESYDKILGDIMKIYSNNEISYQKSELKTDADKESYLKKFKCPKTPQDTFKSMTNLLSSVNPFGKPDTGDGMLYADRDLLGHSNQCCKKGNNTSLYSASECNTCVDSCVNKSCQQITEDGNDITKCQTGINDCDATECDKTADEWGYETDRKNACRAACNKIYDKNKTLADGKKEPGYVPIDQHLPFIDKDDIINGIDKSIVDPKNDVITNAHKEFARNLMRSIGCNRIKPITDTETYAYYSPIDRKCKIKNKI